MKVGFLEYLRLQDGLASPEKLRPEHVKIGCRGSLDKAGGRDVARYRDPRRKGDVTVDLSIGIDLHRLASANLPDSRDNLYYRSIRDEHRARGEHVRCDWCYHGDIAARSDDGSAGRKGVGSGPGRRREDQAVAAIRTEEITVDPRLELDHARAVALVDDDIVKRDQRLDLRIVGEGCLKKSPLDRPHAPGVELVDHLLEVVDGELREESEASEVHA